MSKRTIEQQFQKLDEIAHVLLRPGRYIGSVKPHTATERLFAEGLDATSDQEITYNPGLLKLFDEIISNSADHSRRPAGAGLTTIKVEVDRKLGKISVFDNGGIPVVKHAEHGQWIPEMIFELRAGSNFNDDDEATLTGQNGEGAGLTCIFSKSFVVETCDSKNSFKMEFSNNSRTRSEPEVKVSRAAGFTRITYFPDFEKLGMDALDESNYLMLFNRVVEVAATNSHLKIYWNGKRVEVDGFKSYIERSISGAEFAFDDEQDFKVGVAKSENGFQHTAFVNTTRTKIGGTHIHYVTHQIVEGLRTFLEKKAKCAIKPADIRNHLHIFIDATIVNPRYSSQTKDELITEPKDYGRSWTVPPKMIQKLLKSPIIQAVLDWVQAKAQAAEMAELRKLNKEASKLNPKRVDKFDDAVERKDRHKCAVFITEGDSARSSIQNARGKNTLIGSYSLRGKPLSVYDEEMARIIANNEFANLLTITGLRLGEPVKSLQDLRFGRIVILSDADLDGYHISALLLSFFAKYWPELFTLGVICRMQTPVYIAKTSKGEIHEFNSIVEYETWAKAAPKHKADYFKGLGTFDTESFERFLANMDKYLVSIDPLSDDDTEKLELAFSSAGADRRKTWLQEVRYFDIED